MGLGGKQKRPEPLLLLGVPAFVVLLETLIWWRWGQSHCRLGSLWRKCLCCSCFGYAPNYAPRLTGIPLFRSILAHYPRLFDPPPCKKTPWAFSRLGRGLLHVPLDFWYPPGWVPPSRNSRLCTHLVGRGLSPRCSGLLTPIPLSLLAVSGLSQLSQFPYKHSF